MNTNQVEATQEMLAREIDLFHQGGKPIEVISPGLQVLAEAYPEIGLCHDITTHPWRPIELSEGMTIVETQALPETIEKIKSDPRFTLFWPPETIADLGPVEIMQRIAIGQVQAGQVYICCDGNIQFSIHKVDDHVTFEMDVTPGCTIETQVYKVPVIGK